MIHSGNQKTLTARRHLLQNVRDTRLYQHDDQHGMFDQEPGELLAAVRAGHG